MITSSQRDLYSGVLHKCGGRIKSWTKRWMILKSDYCLYYYKDANKGHLGAISLRDPKFKIRLGQRSDVSWPKHVNLTDTLALVTTPRTYFMYADSRKEADEWRKVLEDAHQELVEVVRTKSFSGYRSAAMSERDAALSSHSMVVGTESPTRLNGARMANRTDSLTSDASSVFGRQFVLSTSSEMDVLTPGSIDAVYDVVVQPLAEDKPHRQDSGDGKTSGDGDCGGGERGGGERGDGERGDGERGGGERGDGDCGGGERGGVCGAWEDPEEALYSVPPVDSNVFEASPKPLKKKLSEGFLSSDEEYNDYVVPPDASPSCPQNISVIVERKEAEPDGKGVEPSGEEAGLIDVDRHPERCLSQNSLEAFYDFAREVAEEGEGGGAMYDAVTSTADSSQELEGEKYEQIDFGTKEPQNSKPMENGESDAERHKKISALNQPLPPPPLLCSHQDSKSGASKQSASLIYEDIPDLPVPASTSNQQQQQQQVEALYEPVAVSRVDNPYSQVEYEEERESEGVGSANIPEAAPRGGDTPPLPPRDHTLSPPSSNSLPPSLPAKNDDVTTPRPVPKPRTSNLSQSPSDRQDPCQLPSDKQDSARSPSNTHESDQLPSNRPSSTHSQSAISPRTSPSTSPRTSPLLPTKISHAPSPSAGVPISAKKRSSQPSPPFSPSSPIQIPQRKFSPPPSPNSRISPRPPSPLVSHRRVSNSEASTHSSVSNNGDSCHGNKDSLEGAHRERARSIKEKGMALFQRRQQEVTSLSEEDTVRRERSMSILKGVQRDEALSPDNKVLFAETLREVENERMKASEERFRWERERMRLEEDRKQLELEKQTLREELERTKQEILQT